MGTGSLLAARSLTIRNALWKDSLLGAPALRNEAMAAVSALEKVAAAAERFVATTSYYRQVKASRAEFEELALALLAARGDYGLTAAARDAHDERPVAPRSDFGI